MTSGAPLRRAFGPAARAWLDAASGAGLDKALADACAPLPEELRAAVKALAYGAARRAYAADTLLGLLADRRPRPPVRGLLCVALSELLADPARTYAIVNEAVAAAKDDAATRQAAGFVNACLRRFCRERKALTAAMLQDPEAAANAPAWWIDRLERSWGREAARAAFAVQALRPPLSLRVNRRRTTPEAWLAGARAQGLAARRIGPDAVMLEAACPVERIPGFCAGEVSVQDAGAQMAAQMVAPAAGEVILDACAAPGGKTAHLLEAADCEVVALEIDPARALRIGENLARLGLAAEVHAADAGAGGAWRARAPFDAILLDAPCTASGIARRHPDVVLSRRPGDPGQLALQQKRLLESLWPLLRVGGRLLYAVCSVFEEEGPGQAKAFLARHPEAGLAAMRQLRPSESPEPWSEGGEPTVTDGFFYALFTKEHA
ncbi:MAG: 16S rRNA (cytosine(967)-C(5))-methyltransferase RsmB [Duodenibacillus sp.]|nr:16S rRNA (cytosine(967)-C(5))-methyltransferase RsmB [Duodenibacillus sp.]